MTQWVYIENGEIVEKHEWLPQNWRNHSGLNLSYENIEFLNSIGWYKVIKEYQEYDQSNFKIVGYHLVIENNQVKETLDLQEITPEQREQELQNDTVSFMRDLRAQRNYLLQQSDWTQLKDVLEKNSEEWYLNWSNYRQTLRDLPSLYPTRTEINWPQPPD